MQKQNGVRHTCFIKKNRNKLSREVTELLLSSTNNFVKDLSPCISNSDRDITAKVAVGCASNSKPKE